MGSYCYGPLYFGENLYKCHMCRKLHNSVYICYQGIITSHESLENHTEVRVNGHSDKWNVPYICKALELLWKVHNNCRCRYKIEFTSAMCGMGRWFDLAHFYY